ncbi:hypothetical protein D5086_000223 [Populus alba]|uniref:Uncharacterized protein n=1 Tax=Populus alba TaxID=43335 RepID=A0ACC4CV89_POPAL
MLFFSFQNPFCPRQVLKPPNKIPDVVHILVKSRPMITIVHSTATVSTLPEYIVSMNPQLDPSVNKCARAFPQLGSQPIDEGRRVFVGRIELGIPRQIGDLIEKKGYRLGANFRWTATSKDRQPQPLLAIDL